MLMGNVVNDTCTGVLDVKVTRTTALPRDADNLRVRVRLAEPERMNGRRVQGDTKSEAGTGR
ncbi:hypothetical protein QFZ32_004494 [Streptomyces canus]|nr:hypothetical protein [Streptomyces canus]